MKKLTKKITLLFQIRRNRKLRSETKDRRREARKKRKSPLNRIRKEEAAQYFREHLAAYTRISNKAPSVYRRINQHIVKLPKTFCLYENPEGVLKIIKEVVSLIEYKHISSIYIDHTRCTQHDLAAEMLFASAVNSLKASKPKTFRIRGTLPDDEKMKRLLKSVGVVKDTAAPRYHENDREHVKLYKMRSDINESSEKNIFEQDRKSAATTGFVDYLNDCLGLISSSLEDDDENKLSKYLAEVLGNAEDHSGEKLWQIVGYLDSTDPQNLCCEIVIFNVGKTFYETFEEKVDTAVVNDKRLEYINQHKRRMSEELLTLVYAMQQNASSKLDEQIDRGQGTKYFMELFHHLTDKNKNPNFGPKMLILSGGAILKMDGTYSPIVNNDKLVYAMNKANDLSIAPDKRYIHGLGDVSFPGAVIYIRYSLQEVKDLEQDNETM
ncbi:hypothetical protein ACPUEJ_01480 [Vibrio tubiashii]|uniref:hypothetical protein n=1 Tax=Vibrio tubiashii TaxID=29498 RepID=UPI003CE50EB6